MKKFKIKGTDITIEFDLKDDKFFDARVKRNSVVIAEMFDNPNQAFRCAFEESGLIERVE